jgi:hypothetical protein
LTFILSEIYPHLNWFNEVSKAEKQSLRPHAVETFPSADIFVDNTLAAKKPISKMLLS